MSKRSVLSAAPLPAPGRGTQPARHIGNAATRALYEELALSPKPGLVTLQGSGSHADMDARTFWRSLLALRRYFPACVDAGLRAASLQELQQMGIAAECAMLRATCGINTHRGAIFTLGLLCASAGAVLARGQVLTDEAVRAQLVHGWGADLLAKSRRAGDSHGRRVVRALGLRGAAEEAAAGFPVLFTVTAVALRQVLVRGGGMVAAQQQALFETMAVLDDTNLAHRGGLHGLRWAQQQAQAFLDAGGVWALDADRHARAIDAAFVARRLSPGGSADLLAAACWLVRVAP